MAAPKIRIRKTENLEVIQKLDTICFDPAYDYPVNLDGAAWWIALDGDEPIGYAGVKVLPDKLAYMCRVGVLPSHRGLGIQKKFIRARVAWCKKQEGVKEVITYTIPSNVKSSNNLIECGFQLYRPEHLWEGPYSLYWYKEL